MLKVTKYFQGNSLRTQLIKGFVGNAGLKVLNMALVLVCGIFLARTLGPENYGIYAFVLSIVTLLGLPTQSGLPTLIVRETARYQYAGDWRHLKGLLSLANGFVIAISSITALLAAVFVWWKWGDAESMKASAFLWALLMLPLGAFSNIRSATLRGFRKVVQGNLPEHLVRPLGMIVLLGLSVVLGFQVTAERAVQYNLIAVFVAFVIGTLLLTKIMPGEVWQAQPSYRTNTWIKSLIPLSLYSLVDVANSQLNILLLGVLSTDKSVGLFRVAYQGAALVAFGLSVINTVIAPNILILFNSGDRGRLQKMLTVSARVTLAISLPVAIILILFGKEFIELLFGKNFIAAWQALVLLTLSQIVNVSFGSGGLILDMTGNEKETIKGSLMAFFANFCLSLILIPHYGLVGAAIASMASMIIRNVVWSIKIYTATGLNSTFIYFGLSDKRDI